MVKRDISLAFASLGSMKPLKEGFMFAQDLGIKRVELFAKHFPPLAGADDIKASYSERDLELVSNLAEQHDIRIDCLLAKSARDLENYLVEILDAIRAASHLGAKYVLLSMPQLLFEGLQRLPELFTPLLKEADESGTIILLENEPFDSVSYEPDQILKIFESVSSPLFRLCFDPCNLLGQHPEPFPEWYEALSGYIEKLHLKGGALFDSEKHPQGCRDRPYGPTRESERYLAYVPFSESSINFDGLVRQAKTNPGVHSYTLDSHIQDWNLLEDCVQRDMKWLSQILKE